MRVTTESQATLEILRISTPSLTAPGITFIAPGTTSTTPTVPTTEEVPLAWMQSPQYRE